MGRNGCIVLSVVICFLAAEFCYADVFTDSDKPLIFPIPQQMQLTDTSFLITDKTVIAIPGRPSQHDIFLAQFLTAELADRFGFAIKTVRIPTVPKDKSIIVMGSISNPLIRQYCKKNDIKINKSDPGAEGYVLQVDKNVVVIAGSDDAGTFYGLQSLRQLLNKYNGSISITGVQIRDWPYKPFRAIRLYIPGKDNLPFFKRFLRNFMAMHKYNKVIMEVNAAMRLDRHPELNAGAVDFAESMIYTRRDRPRGPHDVIQDSAHFDTGDGGILEKQEVADLVQYARANHIDVIPEIPSLTHSYYLLAQHRELAEIPNSEWPDTYCPSNPKSYELLFDVLDEYIDVMKPNMINIGHDEWRMPVGVCPRCKDKNYADLFVGDVKKIYNYLSKKKIKIAMWGDHLMESVRGKGLNWGSSAIFPGPVFTLEQVKKIDPNAYIYNLPGGVPEAQVRKFIPKDILVLNWFWSKTQEIEGLWGSGEKNDQKLQEMGFKQAYGNFEANIQNWAQRSKQPGIVGGAPSSWAASTEFNLGKDQMIDFLGCANLLWSTHWPQRKELVEIVRDRTPLIHKLLSGEPEPSDSGDLVIPLKITQYFNVSKTDEFIGHRPDNLHAPKIVVGKKIFNLADANSAGEKYAIAVGTEGAQKNPSPREVIGIKVGRDVTGLIFLHACAVPSNNYLSYSILYDFPDTADLLGWYEIVYEDNYVEIIPIRYGWNILEWDGSSENYCYAAEPVSCAAEGANPVTFYAFEWTNARLGKKIEQINLIGSTGFKCPKDQIIRNNAVILLAVSAVEKRKVASSP